MNKLGALCLNASAPASACRLQVKRQGLFLPRTLWDARSREVAGEFAEDVGNMDITRVWTACADP